MSLFSLIITVECFFELFKKFKYLKKKTCFEEENSFYAKKRNSYINFHFSFTSYLYETYLPNERTTGVCNSELIFCASHRSFNFLSFFLPDAFHILYEYKRIFSLFFPSKNKISTTTYVQYTKTSLCAMPIFWMPRKNFIRTLRLLIV